MPSNSVNLFLISSDSMTSKCRSDDQQKEQIENNSLIIYHHKIDYAWCERLFYFLNISAKAQYQLACLSTLGGAYHLTDKPMQAFLLAKKQELVASLIGARNVIVRAKIFQAVNLALLGKTNQSKKLLKECKRLAMEVGMEMPSFYSAIQNWMTVTIFSRKAITSI
mmetsp:Transcript_35548/g.36228  ORF Transcript_35548/g.36228 Transcript_35548/m.36228 type:complete len:166 (-) Transcript_35548:229-726(-)